jgi:succinoglycan biosynthesis protein ExoA
MRGEALDDRTRMNERRRGPRVMAVIPCLNEASHIEALIRRLLPAAERLDMPIHVVDGGSTDGTIEIVSTMAATNRRVRLMHNMRRIQSAAINLAVAEHGIDMDYFIRIDAHGGYPDDYCDRLVDEMDRTGADSVVVAMKTEGEGSFQKAAALAQNSPLGNGGARHRAGAAGHWTDHGHHALMSVAAFRAVGGYDESFSHNEDAELDHRLRVAGFRIWMTDRTTMTYYPRDNARALFRQYLGYGRGRAKTILKHGIVPKLRQMIPVMVLPAVAGATLAVISTAALLPALVWMGVCLAYGVVLAVSARQVHGLLSAICAMIMHLAWSAGFWLQLLVTRFERRAPAGLLPPSEAAR